MERYFNNLKYEFSQIEIDIEDKIIKNKNEIQYYHLKELKKEFFLVFLFLAISFYFFFYNILSSLKSCQNH